MLSLSRSRSSCAFFRPFFAPISCALLLAFFLWSASGAASFAAAPGSSGGVVDLGSVVTPRNITRTTIGIPAFEREGSVAEADAKLMVEVIYNDLEIFSDFQRARNQNFVEETHRRDVRANRIDTVDYAEWRAVGCDFALKGKISGDGGSISAECRLFDVIFGLRTFGLRFPAQPASNARALAHHISDSIIEAVFDEPGIARTRIVYVGRMPDGRTKELFLMDADGHNARQLTADGSIAATPCWGMNGTEIYYTSYKDVNPDLCGIQLSSRVSWFISRRPGLNVAPSWSQKTQRIALSLGRDGNSEIYTMDRSGLESTLKRLTRDKAIDTSPSWNPAGNQMVFTSDRTGNPHVWVMDADGRNQRRLTSRGSYNDSATWSPKGDRIAFVARDQGRFDIYTMNLNGEGLNQLTAGPGSNEDPCWAPDGRHLVFSSDRSGTSEIYLMDVTRAADEPPRRLTRSPGSFSADWSPLGSR